MASNAEEHEFKDFTREYEWYDTRRQSGCLRKGIGKIEYATRSRKAGEEGGNEGKDEKEMNPDSRQTMANVCEDPGLMKRPVLSKVHDEDALDEIRPQAPPKRKRRYMYRKVSDPKIPPGNMTTARRPTIQNINQTRASLLSVLSHPFNPVTTSPPPLATNHRSLNLKTPSRTYKDFIHHEVAGGQLVVLTPSKGLYTSKRVPATLSCCENLTSS